MQAVCYLRCRLVHVILCDEYYAMDYVRDMECYHSGVAPTGARRREPNLECAITPTGARRREPDLECAITPTGARRWYRIVVPR